MSDKWNQYFPFDKGDELDVDGPWNYNGTAEVIELNEGVLEFHLHLPAVHIFFHAVPEVDVHFGIEFVNEGGGNKAKANINGRDIEDNEVIITSRPDERVIQSSVLVQGRPLVIHLRRNGEALELKIQGYDFTVSRKELF